MTTMFTIPGDEKEIGEIQRKVWRGVEARVQKKIYRTEAVLLDGKSIREIFVGRYMREGA